MKITIQNWGPVGKFQYDFSKSLIVTYGENNIGKSYAMQVVYLFLKNLVRYARITMRYRRNACYYTDSVMESQSFITEMVKAFTKDTDADSRDISVDLQAVFAQRLAQELFPQLSDSLKNTFGTYENILNEDPEISLELGEEIRCLFHCKNESADISIKRKPTRLIKTLSDFHKSRNGKKQFDIYIYEGHVSTPIQLMEEEMWKIRREFSLAVLKRVKDVYFLPASRSGIYTGMNTFGPILAQISQNRAYIKGPIQIPSIPEPISDYYMQLSEIGESTKGHFAEFARQIEEEILKGEVVYHKKSKSIVYRPFDSQLQLEMSDTSSMVSEISPITAFLKYVVRKEADFWIRKYMEPEIKPSSVIFIEEPEAHLHPGNQVALIRAFAEFSKQNVILVFASHSNYIFNQLNNLVLDRTLSQDGYSPILLKKEGNKSVSCYLYMDDLGVDDENFADISGKLMDEREEIIERLMRESEEPDATDDTEGRKT